MGGMEVPAQEPDRNLLIKTYARWQEISAKAGVDTLIANHAAQDSAIDKVEFLRARRAGDWNPLVLGADAYRRYYEVQKECIRARLVISGQRVEE
jgi:metallo-beta-lactamase class B